MLWNLTLYLCTCITHGGACFWIWLLSSKSFFSLSQCNKSMPTVNPWWKRDFPPHFVSHCMNYFLGFLFNVCSLPRLWIHGRIRKAGRLKALYGVYTPPPIPCSNSQDPVSRPRSIFRCRHLVTAGRVWNGGCGGLLRMGTDTWRNPFPLIGGFSCTQYMSGRAC